MLKAYATYQQANDLVGARLRTLRTSDAVMSSLPRHRYPLRKTDGELVTDNQGRRVDRTSTCPVLAFGPGLLERLRGTPLYSTEFVNRAQDGDPVAAARFISDSVEVIDAHSCLNVRIPSVLIQQKLGTAVSVQFVHGSANKGYKSSTKLC